jgi:hypothetical protein
VGPRVHEIVAVGDDDAGASYSRGHAVATWTVLNDISGQFFLAHMPCEVSMPSTGASRRCVLVAQ